MMANYLNNFKFKLIIIFSGINLYVGLISFLNASHIKDENIPSYVGAVHIQEIDDVREDPINFKEKRTTSSVNQNNKMPFQLGFEFQEINNLCPWAENKKDVQKKPLFSLVYTEENKKVWDVVIDTVDIEFVMPPFAYHERAYVKYGIKSIVKTLQNLVVLLENNESSTFSNWTESIKNMYMDKEFSIRYSEDYKLFSESVLVRPMKGWQPRFTPQATIQHPLEFAIPLYFSIFGFERSDYMMPFSASLPFLNSLKNTLQYGESKNFKKVLQIYNSELGGLIFLHALTLVQIVPDVKDTDDVLLNETHQNFNMFQQIDPKMKLTLMSRRPFTSILNDIDFNNYSEMFKNAMQENYGFLKIYEVPAVLNKINYAEQFFEADNSTPKNLVFIKSYFKESFVRANDQVLIELLQKGVFSTVMLRNLKDNLVFPDNLKASQLYENFYELTINSIEHGHNKPILDINTFNIQEVDCQYDTLSPPWFLEEENAMGRYKEVSESLINKYGKAIIEVRAIKDVSLRFLKKINLDDRAQGLFLVLPNKSLKNHALGLFDFLNNFGTKEDYDDFCTGISYAAVKN